MRIATSFGLLMASVLTASHALAATWEIVPSSSPPTHIRKLSIDKNGVFYVADRLLGFWRSTDAGGTWTAINTGIASTNGWSINASAFNSDLVAGTWLPGGQTSPAARYYHSTNMGTSWTMIPGGYTFTPATNYDGTAFTSNGTIVMGHFWGPVPADTCLWTSTDHGVSSVKSAVDVGEGCDIMGLSVSPFNGDVWYAVHEAASFS